MLVTFAMTEAFAVALMGVKMTKGAEGKVKGVKSVVTVPDPFVVTEKASL